MLIDFDSMEETVIPHFKGGEREIAARMYVDGRNKIMRGRLVSGASIGGHTHDTSSEIIFVLSGTGRVLYDGGEETVTAGQCHYCPKGHGHSLQNTGPLPLEFFAVVPEQ